MLQYHMKSLETGQIHPKKCVVCGEDAHYSYGICGKALYMLPTRGPNVGKHTLFIIIQILFLDWQKRIVVWH